MTDRELAIGVIVSVARVLDRKIVKAYADSQSVFVADAAHAFCSTFDLGRWNEELIADNDVSVPHELYEYLNGTREVSGN